jgi:D-glycero-D-manno-heptose 1,7-bisphosphate phosphatase
MNTGRIRSTAPNGVHTGDTRSARRRAVFLDRDGTLNVNHGYVGDPANVELIPAAAEGVRALAKAGFAVVVASNQSGIARGYFTATDADAVDARVRELLAQRGAAVDAFYRCPHLPEALLAKPESGCDCRKPKPAMLLRAAADLNLDLARSWMIGDRLADMQAGHAAGCRCVAVDGVPPHAPPEDFSSAPPEHRAHDLMDAAQYILSQTAADRQAEARAIDRA